MKKICVYTCITGNYDFLKELLFKEEGVDYFCFTDNRNILSETWSMVYLDNTDALDNVRFARKIKILGHETLEPYDVWIWLDASFQIKKSILEFVGEFADREKADFFTFRHSIRDCIYDEAEACVFYQVDAEPMIRKQMKLYREEGYPEKNGLLESGLLIRNARSDTVKATMALWFDQVLRFSRRDQLSFNYCIEKTGLRVSYLSINPYANEWFSFEPHPKKPDLKYFVFFQDGTDLLPEPQASGSYHYLGDTWIASFPVPDGIERIRFDLGHNAFLELKEFCAESGGEALETEPICLASVRDKNSFLTCNPSIFIRTAGKKDPLVTVKLKIKAMNENEISEFFNTLLSQRNDELRRADELAETVKSEIEGLRKELENAAAKKEEILNSTSWRITKPFRMITGIFKKNKKI